MSKQIKNVFDSVTTRKIVKSLGLNVVSAAGAFLVAIAAGTNWKIAALVGLGTFGGFLVNTAKEYMKGE